MTETTHLEAGKLPVLRPAVKAIVGLALTLLMTPNFAHNILGVIPQQRFERFVIETDAAVPATFEYAHATHRAAAGMYYVAPVPEHIPYLSAFALDLKVMVWTMKLMRLNATEFMDWAYTAQAFLFAAVLTWLAFWAFRELGLAAALSLLLFTNLTVWTVMVVRHLYQAYFLYLLPMTLSLALFPAVLAGRPRALARALGWIGAAILIKALCIPDYMTNVILSAAVGPLYHGLRQGRPLRRIAGWMAAVLVVGGVAGLLSIVLTAVQAGLVGGSMGKAFNDIVVAYFSRGYSHADPLRDAPAGVSVWQILGRFLGLPGLGFPTADPRQPFVYWPISATLYALPIVLLLALLGGSRRRALLAWGAATVWGLAATLSWGVLLKGHMWHHLHKNGLIFSVPYLPMLYILAGAVIAALARQAWLFAADRLFAAPEPAPAPAPEPARRGKKRRR